MKKLLFVAIVMASPLMLQVSRADDAGVDAGVSDAGVDAGADAGTDAGLANGIDVGSTSTLPTNGTVEAPIPTPVHTPPIKSELVTNRMILIYPILPGFEPSASYTLDDADSKALYNALAVQARSLPRVVDADFKLTIDRKVKSSGVIACTQDKISGQKLASYYCTFNVNYETGVAYPSAEKPSAPAPKTQRLAKTYRSKDLVMAAIPAKVRDSRARAMIQLGKKESEVLFRFLELTYAPNTPTPRDQVTSFSIPKGISCSVLAQEGKENEYDCTFSFDYRTGAATNAPTAAATR